MVSLSINGQKMNGEIIVFYVFSKYCKNVYFKGILDMDLFEEPYGAIKFIDKDLNFLDTIPPNPYEKHSTEWKAYNEITFSFKVTDELITLLGDCCGLEHYQFEEYDIEMESLYW